MMEMTRDLKSIKNSRLLVHNIKPTFYKYIYIYAVNIVVFRSGVNLTI